MHQLVKLTDAIWLSQLAISSPLIHALGDPSQAPTRIRIYGNSLLYELHKSEIIKIQLVQNSELGE